MVAVWRRRSSKSVHFSQNHTARAADVDLDMRRPAPRRSRIVRNFSRLLRWMMPEGNTIARPMRSIAREIEEAFPTDQY